MKRTSNIDVQLTTVDTSTIRQLIVEKSRAAAGRASDRNLTPATESQLKQIANILTPLHERSEYDKERQKLSDPGLVLTENEARLMISDLLEKIRSEAKEAINVSQEQRRSL